MTKNEYSALLHKDQKTIPTRIQQCHPWQYSTCHHLHPSKLLVDKKGKTLNYETQAFGSGEKIACSAKEKKLYIQSNLP